MTIRLRAPGDWSAFLLGEWTLERLVREHLGGAEYAFWGTAVVTATRDGELEWIESGTLVGAGVELEAHRSMRYIAQGQGRWALHLDDGDRLGILDLARGRDRFVHDCGPDRYGATFVTGEDELWTRWRCVGPEKNYVATTRARRCASVLSHSPIELPST